MKTFGEKLTDLVNAELQDPLGGPKNGYAAMISALGAALGCAVAIVAKGDPQIIELMLTGLEQQIAVNATGMAPKVRKLNPVRRL